MISWVFIGFVIGFIIGSMITSVVDQEKIKHENKQT